MKRWVPCFLNGNCANLKTGKRPVDNDDCCKQTGDRERCRGGKISNVYKWDEQECNQHQRDDFKGSQNIFCHSRKGYAGNILPAKGTDNDNFDKKNI